MHLLGQPVHLFGEGVDLLGDFGISSEQFGLLFGELVAVLGGRFLVGLVGPRLRLWAMITSAPV